MVAILSQSQSQCVKSTNSRLSARLLYLHRQIPADLLIRRQDILVDHSGAEAV